MRYDVIGSNGLAAKPARKPPESGWPLKETLMVQVKPFFYDITDEEIAYFQKEAAEILRSGKLILGDYTKRFESRFAEYVGVKHAIAVNSGSSALEFLLRVKRAEGKTLLVPTNTNFATVAAVIRVGGRVQYLDMDENTFAPTLGMVQQAVERGPNDSRFPLAGVLWVHIGGIISAAFPRVVNYAREAGLFVLEDAAHAHGSELKGVRSGNLADGAAFSFFATKVVTTGEGGMVTTNDEEEDAILRSLRNQGKRGMDFGGLHTDFGNSSRITEVGALLGLIQLNKLPEMLKRRQAAYEVIAKALDENGIGYVSAQHMNAASHYKLIVRLPDGKGAEDVKRALASDGVFAGGGVYEIPCHQQPVFRGICEGERYPVAERWCPHHICPPLTSGTTVEDARRVGEALIRHLA
jgi:perosamine synthetase